MTGLHIVVDPFDIMESLDSVIAPVVITKDSKETAEASELDSRDSREELIKVLERAANDCAFMAQLTHQGSKALQGYNLTSKAKAALLSGDIEWIEAHVGKLDDRLSTWLWCRLQQENW
jgi:enoyl-[acyl-carrier-protein] reductase (NADH)